METRVVNRGIFPPRLLHFPGNVKFTLSVNGPLLLTWETKQLYFPGVNDGSNFEALCAASLNLRTRVRNFFRASLACWQNAGPQTKIDSKGYWLFTLSLYWLFLLNLWLQLITYCSSLFSGQIITVKYSFKAEQNPRITPPENICLKSF